MSLLPCGHDAARQFWGRCPICGATDAAALPAAPSVSRTPSCPRQLGVPHECRRCGTEWAEAADAASDGEAVEALAPWCGDILDEAEHTSGIGFATGKEMAVDLLRHLAARGYRLVRSQPQSAILPRSGELE